MLERYVLAWEQADVQGLVALLLRDATLEMPPLPQRLSGADTIGASIGAMVFAPAGPGAFRLVRTEEPMDSSAFGAYPSLTGESGEMRAMALHVLGLRDGRIASITAFLNPSLLRAPLGCRTPCQRTKLMEISVHVCGMERSEGNISASYMHWPKTTTLG